MTREEAIAILIREVDDDPFMRTEYREQIHEALNIAIKALEHPEQNVISVVPCGDTINRQAVLDAMRKNHRSGGRDIDGDYIDGDYRECLYDDIISLPSVNPQPKTGYCEDCKHFCKLPYHADTLGKCVHHTGFCPKGDWYCADFEPQESEVSDADSN